MTALAAGRRDSGAEAVRPLPVPARALVVLAALAPLPIAIPSGYGLLWLSAYASVNVAAATLVSFTRLQPRRRRVQSAVDRRFNRAHVNAQHVVDGFAAGLRDDTALDTLNERLETVVERSIQPYSVAVWTRLGGVAR